MPVDREVLRHVPYFAALSREELAQVATVTMERHYERGDLIMLEGEPGGALYYVQAGLVKVFKTSLQGKEQILRLLAAGHTFNEVPALDGGPNPASAEALEPSVIYVIKHVDLRQLIMTRPQVAEAVVLTMAGALRHLVSLVESLALHHVRARVAKILLDQEAAFQKSHYSYYLTQQEIATLAGTAREVVARALKELEEAGAIEMRQGRAEVMNQERLQLLAQESP